MIMKKLFTLSLLVFLTLIASAETIEVNGINYDVDPEAKTATVISKSSGEYSGSIVIPQTVFFKTIECKVTSIGVNAFRNCTGLTSVTIGNGVTSIGGYAFRDCSSLTSITIPNSVTSIGGAAFSGTPWYINQPDGVIYVGKVLYSYKGSMPEGTSISIKDGTINISDAAFRDCNGLTSITIPNSVTTIGGGAFWNCCSLTSMTIPNSVTTIYNYAFRDCSSLTSVTIPNSVTSISEGTYYGCSGLTSITIPNSVISIDANAFENCNSLATVTLGNGIEHIGDFAFANCGQLTDVYCYAENILSPAFYAFNNSYINYTTLHVPAGSVDAYKERSPWNQFKEIVAIGDEEEEEGTTEDEIKITSAGQTTWCSAYDLDFTDVEGLKAYTATGYHRTKGTIWLTRVKEVPAGEGILLIGDEGDYKVPHKSTTAYYANLMVGTVKAITLNETDGEYTNYYLSNGDSGVGFYKVNGSVDLKANRAYLPLLKGTTSGSRGFIGLDFDDGEEGTTDISEAPQRVGEPDMYYNLQGQRMDNPSKGLYIKNGRKVVIK